MSWAQVVLAGIGSAQLVALAWIAAWQARAAYELRKANGHLERQLRAILQQTSRS